MQITQERAVALFVALGISSAPTWNVKRLASKLEKIDELVDDDMKLDAANDTTLAEVLEAITNKESFEITTDGKATTPAKQEPEPEDESKPAKKEKAGKPKAAKKEKAAKPKEEKERAKSRPYCAGVITAKHGLVLPVTDEAVADLDALYGRANDAESRALLKRAVQIINGYKEGLKNNKK